MVQFKISLGITKRGKRRKRN